MKIILAFLLLVLSFSSHGSGNDPIIYGPEGAAKVIAPGGLQPIDSASTCTSTLAGSMRWHASAMEVCDGNAWTSLGGSGGANATLSNLSSPTSVNQSLLLQSGKSVRVPSNGAFLGRNAGNTADTTLIRPAFSNGFIMGDSGSYTTSYIQGNLGFLDIAAVASGGAGGLGSILAETLELYGDPIGNTPMNLKFYDGNTNFSATLKVPASLAADYALTLPPDDGNPGQFLQTDGSGILTWASAGASGVAGAVQFSDGSAFASNAANFFWDNANSRLGIGTSTPAQTLVVKTGDDYGITHTNGTTELTTYVDNTAGVLETKTSTPLYLATGDGAPQIYMDSTPNKYVGLNTASPDASLDVHGVSVPAVVKLRAADNNYVALTVPSAPGVSATFELPAVDGSANQALVTDGSGVLSFGSPKVNIDDIVSGSGKYFSYKPNGAECGSQEILKWNSTDDQWECAASVGTLANNTYFVARNAANTGDVNLFKANASDDIYFGSVGTGHDIFFQSRDIWFTADRNIDFYAVNNQANFIGNSGGTLSLGFSDKSQANYYRIQAADSMSGNFTQVLPISGPASSGQIMVVTTSGATTFGGTDTVPVIIDTKANGTAGSTNDTGSITVSTGGTNSTVTDVKTGSLNITTGASTGTHSPAGDIQSGSILMNSGAAVNGFSGAVEISSGASAYQSGDVTVRSGDGTVDNDGYSGDLFLQSGTVTGGTAQAGSVKIQPGTNPDDTQYNGTVDISGHIITEGTAPTITAGCGTSPSVAGTDTAGRIDVGTGGVATSCTITFNKLWATAPVCMVEDESTSLLVTGAPTTTTLVISAATPFTASDKVTYHCVGY